MQGVLSLLQPPLPHQPYHTVTLKLMRVVERDLSHVVGVATVLFDIDRGTWGTPFQNNGCWD